VGRLDPRSKIALYEGTSLAHAYKIAEENVLKELRTKIYTESQGVPVYEGRFGASPREIRGILHRACENSRHATVTPMAIFAELRRLVRDKTVYEFLQFEPRGRYHDAERFIESVEEFFAAKFESEVLSSMTLVGEGQYESHLQKYIDHVVAFIKKEKIYNSAIGGFEEANSDLMREFEKIIGVTGSVERHRQGLLARIAATKIENPSKVIDTTEIFADLLEKMRGHYHEEKSKLVDEIYKAMVLLDTDDRKNLSTDQATKAEQTFAHLEKQFGYDRDTAKACLRFMMGMTKKREPEA
jgi:predicted Ser/Thr protein kinase